MKSIAFATVATVLLTACSTTATPTYTAMGSPGYRIVCGGFFGDGDMGSCYQKAGELCENQGYKVLQTSVSSLIIECKSDSRSEGFNNQ
jgi:hypothetical protein